MSLKEFAEVCDAPAPSHIRPPSNRFTGLMSAATFREAAASAPSLRVSFSDASRKSMSPATEVPASEIDRYYESGGTLCITGVEKTTPRLYELSVELKRALGYAGFVDCRAYLSGDGAGYTPHFDDKTVITFQIEGNKVWRVSPMAAVPYPIRNAGQFPDGQFRYFSDRPTMPWEHFAQPDFNAVSITYELVAGDILIVPAGVWHEARAGGHSLSLAIALSHVVYGSAIDIVIAAIKDHLISDPNWRRTPPLITSNSARGETSLQAVDEFFLKRMNSLSDVVQRMTEDRTSIVETWVDRLSRTSLQ